jgi:predicted Zn-dependent peptidase
MLPKLIATLLVLIAARAFAQDIPVERYTLDNGMTVILRRDASLPVSCVNIWYRVGAKDEPPGRSGFAHLFEHLMFMGTTRVPGNDFDVIMESGGGSNNASTSLDRTNYFSSGPSSLLPTLLWLDADRLEDLGRATDQAKLDKQRDVVRNELRQMVENAPYQKSGEYIFRLMYPPGHPYHNAVYGTHEDLESATVHNVRDFFATYYVPNNASLVVAGDFDPAAIKPLIQRLFGSLPRGGEVKPRQVPPAKLDRVVRETMLDQVQLPMVRMVWHSPAWYAEGDAEMDLLSAVLAQGKNSRLYQRLVMQDKLAVEVSAYQASAGLGSLFQIDVLAAPHADLSRVEAIIDEELSRLGKEGISPGELDAKKATYELGKLASLQQIEAVADKLNEYEYIWGEPNSFKRDLDRYRNATPAKVQWWAMQTLDPARRAIIRVLPQEPQRSESPRDARPAPAAMGTFTPAAPTRFTLANGIPVMLWNRPELPLVSMLVQFAPAGALTQPATAGLPELTAQMLSEGTGSLDSVAFAAAMQALGADFHAGAGHESAAVTLTVLKRNFDRAAALALDALRRPSLSPADWERVKRLHLESLRQQDEEPTIVAARVGAKVLFGSDNPYGWPVEGTPETVGPLTLEQIKHQHTDVFRPSNAMIFIAGDISSQEAKSALDRLVSDWPQDRPATGVVPDLSPKPGSGLRVVIVDRPEAVQTVIRFIAPGPRFQTNNRTRYQVLNTILGGSFTSRLNQNLRENNGFTYGAGSGFTMTPLAGWFTARSSVQAEVTGPALREFMREFARLRGDIGDISDDEVTKARETIRTETVQSFASLSGVVGVAANLALNNAPFDTVAADLASLNAISAADLNAFSRAALPIDQGVLVLVGDKKLITSQIAELGLPAPVEVDVRGRPK